MRTRVRARRTALDLVLILLIAAVATSDAAAQAPAVRDAERFRTEGDLNAAVNVLRDHLTRQTVKRPGCWHKRSIGNTTSRARSAPMRRRYGVIRKTAHSDCSMDACWSRPVPGIARVCC
jgi:hypothetical protein